MTKQVVIHSSLWVIFSFFYLSGLQAALVLAIDGQAYPSIGITLLYTFIFNLLVGHIITKYEKLFPMIASVVIAAFGVVGFGCYFTERLAGYSNELIIGLTLSLPFATFIVREFKQKSYSKTQ
ncbi:hypothetical protein L1285_13455 [Pseudoalteromonas sp. DL2-H2.2]|uniref:hypothetical protein n=1 Tax=Pseudoalteromonas sp. DL2-H2.2 TaxID=2908889 RepID=UPI001F33E8E9|nr:hypothetical protein [Pseudoalteromonas sp. DL2-H2.2]MCF2909324.1 hypothetical protein [Pseudoalteromonas sp. DL2-H2.2]